MRIKLESGAAAPDRPRRVKISSAPRRFKLASGQQVSVAPTGPSAQAGAAVVASRTLASGGTEPVGVASAAGPQIVNAFYSDQNLVLVAPGGVLKRYPARYSLFVEQPDLSDERARTLKGLRAVVGMERVGKWWRIDCRDFEYRRNVLNGLAGWKVRTYEGDLNPVRRYLLDFPVSIVPPRACFLDIETDSRCPFSQKENARILCVVVVDAISGKPVFKGMLNEDTNDDEKRLLLELWQVLDKYDQVIAWNGDRFDFPVIKARTLKRNIKVPWKRWLWLDQLELFRRMNTAAAESGEEKASFALGAIAKIVLGEDEGKLDVDSSKTWEYWEAGGDQRQLLLDYCVRDTELMPRIEAEGGGYIKLLNTICEVAGTFPDSYGVNPQGYVESFLLRLSRNRGTKPETRPDSYLPRTKDEASNEYVERAKEEQFKGAFVLKPKTHGIERNVHVCDFAGLYPNVILSWNMSPESRRPGPVSPNEARPSYLPRVEWNPEDHRPEGCAYAPGTGEVFHQDVIGMLPEALGEMMALRKYWTDLQATFPPGTPEHEDAKRRSSAYKIAANSFYGVVGAQTSRFFVREVAESVTQAGVWLIQQTIKAAEKRGMNVIYGDTDSAFVTGCTEQGFREFVKWCNEELYPYLLASKGCARNHIKLAYEKEFSWLVIVTAKRYVGKYAHYKGTRATVDSKPEIRGLEYRRGDTARLARSLQKEVVDILMEHEDRATAPYVAAVEAMKQRIISGELALADFVIAKRLSKSLKSYKVKIKKDGTPAAGAAHVAIANILKARGRDVSEGAKIEYVCVDGHSSPKKCIPAEDYGKPDQPPVDRHDLWESVVYPPTMALLQAALPSFDWKRWEVSRPPRLTLAQQKRATAAAGELF